MSEQLINGPIVSAALPPFSNSPGKKMIYLCLCLEASLIGQESGSPLNVWPRREQRTVLKERVQPLPDRERAGPTALGFVEKGCFWPERLLTGGAW